MERYYTDRGYITKGMSLNVLDETDNKFCMLIPVSEMPETASAPSTQEKTVLSDGKHTFVQGLQSSEQKTYAFNYHRDNINRLKEFTGKVVTLLERNADDTGEKFRGEISFGRNSASTDSLSAGQLFITVSEADEFPLNDVRDLIKPTATVFTSSSDVTLVGTASKELALETSPLATVTASSDAPSVATATVAEGKLTITGVAAGKCIVTLTASATGEASSKRTILVEVTAA